MDVNAPQWFPRRIVPVAGCHAAVVPEPRLSEMQMNHSVEIEALRILESLLELPEAERSRWLDTQTLEARVAQRVRALLLTAQSTGRFLDVPPEPGILKDYTGAMPGPGDKLGVWQIVREVDAGGMGVVYLGCRADGAYDQQVAIKVVRVAGLLPDSERHRQLVERFDNDAVCWPVSIIRNRAYPRWRQHTTGFHSW